MPKLNNIANLSSEFMHENRGNYSNIEKYIIETKNSSFLTVYVQDDSIPNKPKQTFLTVHDINTNHESILPFVNCEYMKNVRERSRWIYVVMPGHDIDDFTLSDSNEYPTLDQLGADIADILDELCVCTVIGFGEGAGANVLIRFALQHPNRCLGLITIDFIADAPSLSENLQSNVSKYAVKGNKLIGKAAMLVKAGAEDECSSRGLNDRNLQQYALAYAKRNSLQSLLQDGLDAEVLLLVSKDSSKVRLCKRSLKSMNKLRTTLMVVDGTSDLLSDKEYEVARAVILFCKGCGVLLGIPMFGLEDAFKKVNEKIAQSDGERAFVRQLMINENRFINFLNGDAQQNCQISRQPLDSELPTYESLFEAKQ